jgi:hypothetical protein
MPPLKYATSSIDSSDTSSASHGSICPNPQRSQLLQSEDSMPPKTSTATQTARDSNKGHPSLDPTNTTLNAGCDRSCTRHSTTPSNLKRKGSNTCLQCGVSFDGKVESRSPSPVRYASTIREEAESVKLGEAQEVTAHCNLETYKHWLHISWLSRLPDE